MKKIVSILLIFMIIIILSSCKNQETKSTTKLLGNVPTITGVEDVIIEKGSHFAPIEGVSADDVEDGDLTDQIIVSGIINLNALGEYTLTYTVFDSDQNKTEVYRKVTVIYTDVEAPILTGVGNISIVLGTNFNTLQGVSAYDTIDGDLTDEVSVSGEVNTMKLGEYELTYSVCDEKGNRETKTRIVTVGYGGAVFSENILVNHSFLDDVSGWDVEGATPRYDNEQMKITVIRETGITISQSNLSVDLQGEAYVILKVDVKVKMSEAQEMDVILQYDDNTINSLEEKVMLSTEFQTYTFHFLIYDNMTNGTLQFVLDDMYGKIIYFDEISACYGFFNDVTAPHFIDLHDLYVPVGIPNDAFIALATENLKAYDDSDGYILDGFQYDLTPVELDSIGNYVVDYSIEDSLGNKRIEHRNIIVGQFINTMLIHDPGFDYDFLDYTQWDQEGGPSHNVALIQSNQVVMHVKDPGQWASHTKLFINTFNTNDFEEDGIYMLQFDVKAETARKIQLRFGLKLTGVGGAWIDDYSGIDKKELSITDEYETYYIIFKVDKTAHEHQDIDEFGQALLSLELNTGWVTYGNQSDYNAAKNNNVYFDNIQFYQYVTSYVDQAPEIREVPNKPTTFPVNATLPDFTTYFNILDDIDKQIPVTEDMIDLSNLDITTEGQGYITITVTDSGGNEISYNLGITIDNDADFTPPSIEIKDSKPTEFILGSQVPDFTTYFTITDNVDGNIEVIRQMIDDSQINMNKAGKQTVILKVLDSSNNLATYELEITIQDVTKPTFIGVSEFNILLGETFNPLLGISAYDNSDGFITNSILVDTSALDINSPGRQMITYTVEDSSGNLQTAITYVNVLDLSINDAVQTINVLKQTVIYNDTTDKNNFTYHEEDGHLTVELSSQIGAYPSAVGAHYYLDNLKLNTSYLVRITLDSTKTRGLSLLFGTPLNQDPWIERYDGVISRFEVNENQLTYQFVITTNDLENAKLELNFGLFEGYPSEMNNTINIYDFTLQELME